METKKEIRSRLLGIRNSISIEDKQMMDKRRFDKLKAMPQINMAKTVLCYASIKSEADTYMLMDYLWEKRIDVCLPRVCGDEMNFYRVHSKEELCSGYMKIPEPVSSCELYIPNGDEVIIVPGSGFDRKLFRMGYGKGFYDRFISRYPKMTSIGIAYSCQVIDRLPVDDWDCNLDYVVTESEIINYDQVK